MAGNPNPSLDDCHMTGQASSFQLTHPVATCLFARSQQNRTGILGLKGVRGWRVGGFEALWGCGEQCDPVVDMERMLIDLALLSQADYFVGAFSANGARLIYELMAERHLHTNNPSRRSPNSDPTDCAVICIALPHWHRWWEWFVDWTALCRRTAAASRRSSRSTSRGARAKPPALASHATVGSPAFADQPHIAAAAAITAPSLRRLTIAFFRARLQRWLRDGRFY